MCIICNGGRADAAVEAASRFLGAWERTQTALHEATRAMLEVSKTMPVKTDRDRYDALLIDWLATKGTAWDGPMSREASEPQHVQLID